MPYARNGKSIIKQAYEGHYALPAFNVCSLEMAMACITAAELEKAPIMLATTPGDLEHGSPKVMAAMIEALAKEASVPILLHLDHGDSLERANQCLNAGYGSVMFDGDSLPIEENIKISKEIADLAHRDNAIFEAAAGSWGAGEGASEEVNLTDAGAAKKIFDETGADMLACSVGSRHGLASKLDLDRLQEIANLCKKPLVIHGGSGVPADDIAEAVKMGVVKINIGAAISRALSAVWLTSDKKETHYEVYAEARKAIIEVAREKIWIMKASGKA